MPLGSLFGSLFFFGAMTNFIIIYIYIFKIFVGLQTFQDFFFEFLPFTYSKTKLTIPIKNRPSAGDLQWLRLGPPSFLLETFPKKTGGGGGKSSNMWRLGETI